jgi:hypothetical protein
VDQVLCPLGPGLGLPIGTTPVAPPLPAIFVCVSRFYAIVLLPAVRDDIRSAKRLNYHLYHALKKALYKPGAFMKGILIPLCEVGAMCLAALVCPHPVPPTFHPGVA